ncbi:class I SAM-dependent methyltransferase [Arthrobacter sp. JSM 101049]|uniref:class I SAM-dependent methyltransferase n=1 Tax=Arthrobacter sp. JSM 101049 TaxID=929097 RepID=UPI003561A60C
MNYLYSILEPTARIRPAGGWAATYETIAWLVEQILEYPEGPEVVELGSGIATLWMAYALQKRRSGRLVSVEHDIKFLSLTEKRLSVHGLNECVELKFAPLNEQTTEYATGHWYDLERPPRFRAGIDLLFVDGPPGGVAPRSRYPAMHYFAPLLSNGAYIVLDDVDREVEYSIAQSWLREDYEHGKLVLHERLGRSTAFRFEKTS